MLGTLGTPEIIFIFLLALVLFGPKKLPELGRTIGKAMTEFRRASNELKATFDREMKTLEAETKSLQEATNPYQYDSYNYDYSSYETRDGSYQHASEVHDSTAADPTTASASAPQDAESPSAAPPEGTIAHGEETVAAHESNGNAPEVSVSVAERPGSSTAEHHA